MDKFNNQEEKHKLTKNSNQKFRFFLFYIRKRNLITMNETCADGNRHYK